MKAAAMRYADLLENGCFITHHEQDEIAKLLRRLVMTEDEAWDEMEARLNKPKKQVQTSKTWVSLTDEEIDNFDLPDKPTVKEFVRFIEAKLKELNT